MAERHPKLVSKFADLKDMDYMELFNLRGVFGWKECEQGKLGVDVNSVITYKTNLVVNTQPVIAPFTLGEGVACNKISMKVPANN